MKFTAKTIAAIELPTGKSDHLEFDPDHPGLGIRMRAGGSKMWIFQYTLGAKQRRMTLGSATAISLGKARERASELHAKVRLGQDPASEKTEGRRRAAETFEAVGQQFLARQRERVQSGKMRPRYYSEIERHVVKYLKPLHGLQLASIDRRTVASRLSAIADEAGHVTANRCQSTLSVLFGWAMKQGLVDANPVIGTERREERPRERVLANHELRAIWHALDDDHFGAIMKLLMLTGQRADEIGSLQWSEIGDDAITLPPARTKNRQLHRVPLSGPALTILAAQPRRADADGKLAT